MPLGHDNVRQAIISTSWLAYTALLQQASPSKFARQEPDVPPEATPRPQHTPTGCMSTGKMIGIVAASLVVVMMTGVFFYMLFPVDDMNASTGDLKVRYVAVDHRDIKIYIDGNLKGTYPMDKFVTFYGLSVGNHVVEIRDTSDGFLTSTSVEIRARMTSTVDLSGY